MQGQRNAAQALKKANKALTRVCHQHLLGRRWRRLVGSSWPPKWHRIINLNAQSIAKAATREAQRVTQNEELGLRRATL
jgi:hypothetical protein